MRSDNLAIREQAESEVQKTIRPPVYGPGLGALYAFIACSLATNAFAIILGMSLDNPKVMQGIYITSALAALAAYLPLQSQQKRYGAAVSKRFQELLADAQRKKHQ